MDQNSALKKEAGIAERKLLARNERIQNLEALLQDADRRLAVQNQKFEAQLQAVKERLDQARGELSLIALPSFSVSECGLTHFPPRHPAQKAASGSPLSFGRIAKPLRGGGGSAAAATTGAGPASPSMANPLARVQNEEGCVFGVFTSFSIVRSFAIHRVLFVTNAAPVRV